MAEGNPDWGAAVRAAQGQSAHQPMPSSRKQHPRDGQHDHQTESDSGGHHHPHVDKQLADHTARINALEGHMQNIHAAHVAGDGSGSGQS